MPSGIFYLKSLDRSNSNRRGSVYFLLLPCFIEIPVFNANRVDPDQMLHSAVSDLGLHCLSMSLLWDARLKCVKSWTFVLFSCYILLSQYTVVDLITAHAPISAQSSNLVVFRLQPVYFYLLLYRNICCGYLFELPWQVEAIQTSTHNICFYKENQKVISHKHH